MTTNAEAHDLAAFAEYMNATGPLIEQLAADMKQAADATNLLRNDKLTFELWGKGVSRLTALAQIDPPAIMWLAHIRLLQAAAYCAGGMFSAMNKDAPKLIGYMALGQQAMAEIPPQINPWNEKLQRTMRPLVDYFRHKK